MSQNSYSVEFSAQKLLKKASALQGKNTAVDTNIFEVDMIKQNTELTDL